MSSVDDLEELIATRRLHGLDDNLFKESDKNVANMTEEAFNELIDNLEVVAHLTMYGRKGIKENVKRLQARIKELEEENTQLEAIKSEAIKRYNFECIPVQKVKDKIEEIKEDYEDSKDENGESEYYYPDYTIRKLEELLEDK